MPLHFQGRWFILKINHLAYTDNSVKLKYILMFLSLSISTFSTNSEIRLGVSFFVFINFETF